MTAILIGAGDRGTTYARNMANLPELYEIVAVAEAVTAGDKELRGSGSLNKAGGDSFDGLVASYKGPEGEKPITLDENGSFNLGKLKQGYDTISLEKPGHGKLSRSIYLNRDIDIALVLDYTMFETAQGSGWDLSAQNDGILYRTGYSTILTANSHDSFYVEGYFRYVLALYRLQERLVQQFPTLLLENCCGGGGRFDPGMLYYSPQIWTSDNMDPVQRLLIQEGTALVYPLSTMGAHICSRENHYTGRRTPLKTRGNVAMAGTFGYEVDVTKLTPEEKEEAAALNDYLDAASAHAVDWMDAAKKWLRIIFAL